MKVKLYSILAAICMALALASCEKEIDFDYHDIDPLTVIEAELTPGGAKVGITLTTPMDEPMDRTRLTDATVTLTDLTDATVYRLRADAEGFFVDQTPGIIGHDYRLTIDRAGCHYEADATMYAPTEIKSLQFSWIKMPYDYVAVLQARFLDNKAVEGECYWIKLYRNGKMYMWSDMDDRSASDGISVFTTMTSRKDTDKEEDDEVLFDGDVMTCSITPISRAMYDYLEALQHDSNGPAIFSGDKCLGYFMATTPATDSIVFRPDSLPEYK